MIKLILLLPVLFAFCCFLAAWWQRRSRKGGIRHPVYTDAVIVSKVTQTGYRHHSTVEQSAPVVRYMTDVGERTSVYRYYVPEWQYSYRTGETVQICYDRDNPLIFHICREQRNMWISNLLLCTGVGTLLAYAVLLLQYYK